MSDQTPERSENDEPQRSENDEQSTPLGTEEYGSLSIEDNPEGTVHPADLAGTADESDADVVYQPEHSEEDLKD